MFPTTPILDTAVRADENPLSQGGQWASPMLLSTNSPLQISSNQFAPTTGAESDSYRSQLLYGPDSEAYVDVPVLPGNEVVGVAVRVTNPGTASVNAYYVFWNASKLEIYMLSAGTPVSLYNTSATFSAGDSIGLSAYGTTISLWHKTSGVWSLTQSVIDGTVSGPGYIGMFSDTSSVRMANFGGGTLSYTIASDWQLK